MTSAIWSGPFGELSLDELTAAAGRLARAGELRQVRPGWYAAAS
jgi:hypothetical protein